MPKIKSECAECGAHLERWPSQYKETKYGHFCNKDCLGSFRTRVLVGDLGANFKSGCKKDRRYFRVPAEWHPGKDKSGYVSLHRIIAEARIGKFLSNDEIIHHVDGNPTNNHWSNLEVMAQSEHAALHIQRDAKTGRIVRAANA